MVEGWAMPPALLSSSSTTSTPPTPSTHAPLLTHTHPSAGDFVFGIASIFRVGVDALLAVNPGLAIDTYLQAGMRIRVPPFTSSCGNGARAGLGGAWELCIPGALPLRGPPPLLLHFCRLPRAAPTSNPSHPAATHPPPPAGFLATPPTTGVFSCRAYRVRTGDSLAAIALAFQTTVAAVVAANPELVRWAGGAVGAWCAELLVQAVPGAWVQERRLRPQPCSSRLPRPPPRHGAG